MQKGYKGLGIWLAVLVIMYFAYSMALSNVTGQKMVYSDLVQAIKNEQVISLTINGNNVTAVMKADSNASEDTSNNSNSTVRPTKTEKIKMRKTRVWEGKKSRKQNKIRKRDVDFFKTDP